MPRGIVLTLIVTHTLAVVALTVAIGWKQNRPYPCRRTFEQVQVGMTQAEVEAVVGLPAGKYYSGNRIVFNDRSPWGVRQKGWLSDDAELLVNFGDEGRVCNVSVEECVSFLLPNRWERMWEWVRTGYDVKNPYMSHISLHIRYARYDPAEFMGIFCD